MTKMMVYAPQKTMLTLSVTVFLTLNLYIPSGYGFLPPPTKPLAGTHLPMSLSLSSPDPNGSDGSEVPDENFEHNPFFITTSHTTSRMTFKGDYGDNMVENKAPPRLKLYSPQDSSTTNNDGNGESTPGVLGAKATQDQGDDVVIHGGATTTAKLTPSASTATALKFYSSLSDDEKAAGTSASSFKVGDQGDNMSEVKRPGRLKLFSGGTTTDSTNAGKTGPSSPREVTVESTRSWTIVPPSLRRYSQLSEEEKAAATKLSVLSTGGLQSRFGLKDQGDNLVEQKGRSKLRLYTDVAQTDGSDTTNISSSLTENTVPSPKLPPTRKDQGDNMVIETPTKLRLYSELYQSEQSSSVENKHDTPSPPTRPPTRKDIGDNVVIETKQKLRLYSDIAPTDDKSTNVEKNQNVPQSDTRPPTRKDIGDNVVIETKQKLRLYSDLARTVEQGIDSSTNEKTAPPSKTRPRTRMDQGDNAVIGSPRPPTLRVNGSKTVITPNGASNSTASPKSSVSPLPPVQPDMQQPRERVTLPQQQPIISSKPVVPKMESTPPSWADASASSNLSYISKQASSSAPSPFTTETGNVDDNMVEKNRKPKLRYYSAVKGVTSTTPGSSLDRSAGVSTPVEKEPNGSTAKSDPEVKSQSPHAPTQTSQSSTPAPSTPQASQPFHNPDVSNEIPAMKGPAAAAVTPTPTPAPAPAPASSEIKRNGKRLKLYEPPVKIEEESSIGDSRFDDKGGLTDDGFFIVSD